MKSKTAKVALILVLLTVTGALFRLNQRDYPLFWHDEATTMLHVSYGYMDNPKYANRVLTMAELKSGTQGKTQQTNPFSIVNSIVTIEPAQAPMSFLVVYFWGELFGYSVDSLRLMCVILGVMAIPAAFWLGCELASARCGLLMAAFMAFSPFSLHHCHELRSYSLLLLFLLLTFATFLRAIRIKGGASIGNWIAYCMSLALLFYTHLSSLIVGLGTLLYTVVARKALPDSMSAKAFKNALIFTFVAYAMLTPWALAFASKFKRLAGMGSYVISGYGASPSWLEVAVKWLSGPSGLLSYNMQVDQEKYFPVILTCFVFAAIWVVWRMERKVAALFLSSILTVYACTVYLSDLLRGSQFVYYQRYILGVPVAGFCLLSVALSNLWSDNRRLVKAIAAALAVMVLVLEIRSCSFEFTTRERVLIHEQSLVSLANVINSKQDALLVVTESGQYTNMNQLAALSHIVFPYIKTIWLPSNNFEIVPQATHILAFNPAPKFLDFMKSRGYTVTPTEANCLFELKK